MTPSDIDTDEEITYLSKLVELFGGKLEGPEDPFWIDRARRSNNAFADDTIAVALVIKQGEEDNWCIFKWLGFWSETHSCGNDFIGVVSVLYTLLPGK